tara:strand:- start:27554 stop:28150 length:597 start_codon:yes stop_codon:yes gene_type:complete
MNTRIKELIEQIKQLEEDLSQEIQQQEHSMLYHLKGKKIEFEQSIKEAHRKLKTGVIQWLFGVRPINIITAPVIYGMIIPFILIDLAISFYQISCFPIYKIAKVRRADYIVFDRHNLAYLNIFEKFHCLYCAYANGLVAYIREILARTELYFCPIKHARKVLTPHRHYYQFINYGDATSYPDKLEAFRKKLATEPKEK